MAEKAKPMIVVMSVESESDIFINLLWWFYFLISY
jgi:hypothetical protein